MELMILAFIVILLIVHGVGKLLPSAKSENVKDEYTVTKIEPEPDFERDENTGEPKVVMLKLAGIHENKEENIKKLSEMSGYSEEELTAIVNKHESLTDEEYDNLSDEELDELSPVIKKGLTMQEAKILHSELKESGILCMFDAEL